MNMFLSQDFIMRCVIRGGSLVCLNCIFNPATGKYHFTPNMVKNVTASAFIVFFSKEASGTSLAFVTNVLIIARDLHIASSSPMSRR